MINVWLNPLIDFLRDKQQNLVTNIDQQELIEDYLNISLCGTLEECVREALRGAEKDNAKQIVEGVITRLGIRIPQKSDWFGK